MVELLLISSPAKKPCRSLDFSTGSQEKVIQTRGHVDERPSILINNGPAFRVFLTGVNEQKVTLFCLE